VQRHPFATLGVTLACLCASAFLAWYVYRLAAFRAASARAQQAVAEFDFDEARRQLRRCRRLAPGDASVLLLEAQTARRSGDLAAAADVLYEYEQLPGKDPSHAELEYLLQQAQAGQLRDAARELKAKLAIRHPASEQILEALALGAAHLYHLDVAAYSLKELSDRAPKNAIGRLLRARLDEAMGRRDRRLDMLRSVATEFPAFWPARLYLANILLDEWQYDEALEHYRAVHDRRPDDPAPLLGMAKCCQKLERSDEARAVLNKLMMHHADNSDVLLECGRAALAEKRFDDAESLLRRALALAPNDYVIVRELGTCLHHTGKLEEKDRLLEQSRQMEADLIRLEKMVDAVSRDPSDPVPRLEAAQVCLRNGQKAEGLRWLSGALAIAPNHAATHAALAEYYAGERDLERANYHRQRAFGKGR